jgi:hypothetical protein
MEHWQSSKLQDTSSRARHFPSYNHPGTLGVVSLFSQRVVIQLGKIGN